MVLDHIYFALSDGDGRRFMGDDGCWGPMARARLFATYHDAVSHRFARQLAGDDSIVVTVYVRFPEPVNHADLPKLRP